MLLQFKPDKPLPHRHHHLLYLDKMSVFRMVYHLLLLHRRARGFLLRRRHHPYQESVGFRHHLHSRELAISLLLLRSLVWVGYPHHLLSLGWEECPHRLLYQG